MTSSGATGTGGIGRRGFLVLLRGGGKRLAMMLWENAPQRISVSARLAGGRIQLGRAAGRMGAHGCMAQKDTGGAYKAMLLIIAHDWTDWLALGLIESASAAVLIVILFQVPLGDWMARRRLRKDAEWKAKQLALRRKAPRKYECVGKSKFHGRN